MAKNSKKTQRSRFLFYFSLSITASILILYAFFILTSHFLLTQGHLSPTKPFNSWPFLSVIIFSCILGAFISSVITRIFYRPIRKMSNNFKKISKGEFNVKIDDETLFDEINEMYKNFNIMTHELSNIETLRNDFVVSVSHEFKTPIAAIEGYATLLQNENISDEQRNLYTEKIIQNTRSLSNLTGNILTLSKLEHQDLVADKKTFLLDEQIKQIIINLEPSWSSKNIEFDLNLDETYYSTNESLSHHIWQNLISNAIKYTNNNGKISISIKKDDEQIIATISDNGIGMDEETLKHIFDKFYQADTSHKSEGNGLGLALVKRIVTLLNGTITVTSVPNVGSTFVITLPIN